MSAHVYAFPAQTFFTPLAITTFGESCGTKTIDGSKPHSPDPFSPKHNKALDFRSTTQQCVWEHDTARAVANASTVIGAYVMASQHRIEPDINAHTTYNAAETDGMDKIVMLVSVFYRDEEDILVNENIAIFETEESAWRGAALDYVYREQESAGFHVIDALNENDVNMRDVMKTVQAKYWYRVTPVPFVRVKSSSTS